MTIALTAALILTVTGFLVLLDREGGRAKRERDAERAERQVLLQRIQAPESATYEHAARQLPADGDPFPMSDEQIAEEEERAKVLQFIERHENGAS